MEQLLEKAGDKLLDYGLAGIAIIGLVGLIYILRGELKAVRSAHRLEMAEKEKLINEIQEKRVTEALAGAQAIRSMQTTYDALISALKGR